MDQNGLELPFPELGLTLSGVSVGGVCTSLQVREAGLCVDCGLLTPTSIRMPTLALTHGHVDHAGALAVYLGNRSLLHLGHSTIYAPPGVAEKMERITRIWEEVQGRPFDTEFITAEPGEFYDIGPRVCLRPFATQHTVPSVGYTLIRKKRVLRPDLVGMKGEDIAALRATGEEVNVPKNEPLITFTGDTVPEALANDEVARKARVIVTELSFLGGKQRATVETARMGMHTHIDELLPILDVLECDTVVFMHLSRKHTVTEAEEILKARMPAEWAGRWKLLHHQDRKA
jgi:ribonuclease Z